MSRERLAACIGGGEAWVVGRSPSGGIAVRGYGTASEPEPLLAELGRCLRQAVAGMRAFARWLAPPTVDLLLLEAARVQVLDFEQLPPAPGDAEKLLAFRLRREGVGGDGRLVIQARAWDAPGAVALVGLVSRRWRDAVERAVETSGLVSGRVIPAALAAWSAMWRGVSPGAATDGGAEDLWLLARRGRARLDALRLTNGRPRLVQSRLVAEPADVATLLARWQAVAGDDGQPVRAWLAAGPGPGNWEQAAAAALASAHGPRSCRLLAWEAASLADGAGEPPLDPLAAWAARWALGAGTGEGSG